MPNFSTTPLEVLGGITAEVFLRDYWQKKPLLIRNAFPNFQSPLDANELAGLSLESEIESRIIIEHGETPWQLLHGPFEEQTYENLPPSHWTLLVQAVDQFIPEVAELQESFRFLPSWRIDDVMISYATQGGGVGPHYDNYDVFLLQAAGQRRWKIGQACNSQSALLKHPDLRILEHFIDTDDWVLSPGDMLYLPPCLAHWGIAEDDECMTWSLGFRAPSSAEIITHYTDFVARFSPDEDRYSDSQMTLPTNPAEIRNEDIQRLRALINEQLNDDRLLLTWFGQFMTEPKYPERVEACDIEQDEVVQALENGALILRNPSARFAWSNIILEKDVPAALLFVSGNSRLFSAHLVELLKLICSDDPLHLANLQVWLENDEAGTLITELIKQGSLEFANE